MMVRIFVAVLLCIAISQSQSATLRFKGEEKSDKVHGHVTFTEDGELVFRRGAPTNNVRGALSEVVMAIATNNTGWSYVYAWTNGSYSDVEQAYSIGYLEAAIDPQIRLNYRNSMGGQCSSPSTSYCKRLSDYLKTNLAFMKKEIVAKRMSDPFWHQVELLLWQIQGMDDAFKGKPQQASAELVPSKLDLDPFGMFFWHVKGGDLDELSEALKAPSERKSNEERVKSFGHCSALVKRSKAGAGQLFVAHDTWNGYDSMLRHMKLYEFNFRETANPASAYVAGASEAFSSYPGSVVSGDDFYVLGSKMVSQETTNGFYNNTLYDIIRNSSDKVVFEFLRTQVANRLARNISEWQMYFAMYNSGTYNNQWMVVDYKRAADGASFPDSGVLGVSEQLPGLVVSKDMTKHLKNTTYWPSYNTPSFPEIYDRSNMTYMVKTFGDFFLYNATPRALIFKRDHVKVVDEASMIRLMRYNDFKHDPLARCKCSPPYSGENGIAARSDLNPANGTYPFGALGHRNHGATDMKMTAPWLLADLGFIGVSSPTFDQQPPFRWSTSGFNVPHFGQPDLWTFPAIITPWRRVRGGSPSKPSFVLTSNSVVVFPY